MESQNIVALCDVDWKHASRTFERYPSAKKYKDFRLMLEECKDIDAVSIATPDHTHAGPALMAMRMGKHVYCEKPLTHSVYEARKLTAVAGETGVATQMGNQGHASEGIRLLCEWIWDGAIGEVKEVQTWTPHPAWPQGIDRPQETPPVPETLAWDLWLGPAPVRPYHPCYLPFNWRGWWDFGTGGLGDMGCHIFDPIIEALKLGPPTSVEASYSTYVLKGLSWDKVKHTETLPRASFVTYRFPARSGFPPLKLTWFDGGLMPPRPQELEEGREMGDKYGGALIIGEKGKILFGSHGAENCQLIPEAKMKEYIQPPKTLPRSVGHAEEWIQACKGGEPAGANFEYSGPLTEMVLLGNIAMRTGKKIYWDSKNLRITNHNEANQWLHREYREGWSL